MFGDMVYALGMTWQQERGHAHPAWGARKLSKWHERQGQRALPSPSTIQAILKRHGRILPEQSAQHRPFQRFQRSQPNELWQMDFKGHFPTTQGRCYPLTILDDYSRFAIALQACPDERGETVQERLSAAFRCYGLPLALLVDNDASYCSDRPFLSPGPGLKCVTMSPNTC